MLRKFLSYITILTVLIAGCGKDKAKPQENPAYNVNATTNVQYGQNTNYAGNNEKLKLDIYSPKDASATRTYPLVVLAHSGSFLEGDKNGLAPLCQAIAEKGFIAVTIDYRLGWDFSSGQGGPSACNGNVASLQEAVYRSMQDYNAALRFLVHNADKYAINTDWIFIGGSSAGAVSAVNTIYTTPAYANSFFSAEKIKLGPLFTADNSLTDNFTVRGNINMWGAIGNDSLITSASAVPMIAFHGTDDETIPFDEGTYAGCANYPSLYGSKAMYDKLVSFGVPAALHVAQAEGHGPDIYKDADFLSANISCFLLGLVGKTAKSGMFNNLTNGCQ